MYTISREIGIDAGHRVPTHGSKCRHLHGHRYTIQAICESGTLHESGEQRDMVVDFGFLKEEMMSVIDEPCDHGLILWIGDPLLETFIPDEDNCNTAAGWVHRDGWCTVANSWTLDGVDKLYIIPDIPTAEVLARHWFYRLQEQVSLRSSRLATLQAVKVLETPNCWATYTKEESGETR